MLEKTKWSRKMKLGNDIVYIGVNDHDIDLFEGQYVVPNGMAYNSYFLDDEHPAVIDAVDGNFISAWLDAIAAQKKAPEYLIVQHMEPDHGAGIAAFAEKYPDAKIVSSAKSFAMMKNFFGEEYESRRLVVAEKSTLSTGKHELLFIAAPMVHWPEVIMTYDTTSKVLFSADAFGKFGALDADEAWACEARRYYIGIVGKYGAQVQMLLKKASALDISMICPAHGPVLTENLGDYIELYDIWSSYRPETEGIFVAYTSVYGHTRAAVEYLVEKLQALGCPKLEVADLAREDMAECVENAFRYRKMVLATTTYNAEIFPFMREFLNDLLEHNYRNRTVALIENGSWAPQAAKQMRAKLEKCPGITFAENTVTIKSALDDASRRKIDDLAAELCADFKK